MKITNYFVWMNIAASYINAAAVFMSVNTFLRTQKPTSIMYALINSLCAGFSIAMAINSYLSNKHKKEMDVIFKSMEETTLDALKLARYYQSKTASEGEEWKRHDYRS